MPIRSVFIGSGSFIPQRRIANSHFGDRSFYLDYDTPLDPADNERVLQKVTEITEIAERRYACDDHVTSDLGFAAAQAAIDDAGIDRAIHAIRSYYR